MAYPSVTYTFSNSTTADATQVNQNFTDLINGLSDGTKDLSISAITCAGNATFNGNTTIGNASSDDLTITASLASSIPLKTHNTYDIGSVTTLGLRAIYMASSGSTKTAKIVAQNNTSDIICTLPLYTGTLRHIPTVISSQTGTYAILASDEFIPCSAAGGSFTATLPTAVGATGKTYTIKRTDQTLANAVTIATTSSQTIDGVTTRKLTTQYEQYTVVSDGSNWHVLEHSYPSVWTAWTPTGSWSSNTTYTGYWKRNGDSIEYDVTVETSGAPTAANLTVTLLTGLTIDTAKLAVANSSKTVGQANILDASNGRGTAVVLYSSTTAVAVQYVATTSADNTATQFAVSSTAPMTFASGDKVFLHFTVPVTNWEG